MESLVKGRGVEKLQATGNPKVTEEKSTRRKQPQNKRIMKRILLCGRGYYLVTSESHFSWQPHYLLMLERHLQRQAQLWFLTCRFADKKMLWLDWCHGGFRYSSCPPTTFASLLCAIYAYLVERSFLRKGLVVKGNLEVKLPTNIKRRKTERAREKRRVRYKRERERVRIRRYRCEKCEESRETLCFRMNCGSGGSKSRLDEAAGAEPSGQMRNEELTPLRHKAQFQVKMSKLQCLEPLLEDPMSANCTPLLPREPQYQVNTYCD